jgi:hypothetical protein
MKYSVEIGSDGRIYTLRFIKTNSGIQRLLGGGTHTQSKVIS